MMTAANINARVTGWGFVVFLVGSIAWSTVGLASDQANLVVSNGFLTLINAIGIWRWLGRQRAYEDGGQSAKRASRRSATPNLFTATGLSGMEVRDKAGETIGSTVEALLCCPSGQVSYVVVRSGGLGGMQEELRAVARDQISFGCSHLDLHLCADHFARIAPLVDDDWPESPVCFHDNEGSR